MTFDRFDPTLALLGAALFLAACTVPTPVPTLTPAPSPTSTSIPFTPRPTITPLPDKIMDRWPQDWRLLVVDRRGALLRVDPRATGNTIDAQRNFDKPTVGLALSPDRQTIFVTGFTNLPGQDEIVALNFGDGMTVAHIPAADGTNFIYALPDGTLLAGSKFAGLMQVLDPVSLSISKTYDLGVRGEANSGPDNFLVGDDGLVYVPLGKHENSLAVLDWRSGEVRYLPQEGQPYLRAVALSPDGEALVTLDTEGHRLLVLDKESGERIQEVQICEGVTAFTAASDRRKGYVYCPDTTTLQVVDLEGYTVLREVDLGVFGVGVWISMDPSGEFVYVGGYGAVMIVDGKTDELLSVIPMPYEVPGLFSIMRVEVQDQ